MVILVTEFWSFLATRWHQKMGIFISSLESPGKTLRCPLMKNSIFISLFSGFYNFPVDNRFWLFCTLIGQPVSWFRDSDVASLCVERKLNLRLWWREGGLTQGAFSFCSDDGHLTSDTASLHRLLQHHISASQIRLDRASAHIVHQKFRGSLIAPFLKFDSEEFYKVNRAYIGTWNVLEHLRIFVRILKCVKTHLRATEVIDSLEESSFSSNQLMSNDVKWGAFLTV